MWWQWWFYRWKSMVLIFYGKNRAQEMYLNIKYFMVGLAQRICLLSLWNLLTVWHIVRMLKRFTLVTCNVVSLSHWFLWQLNAVCWCMLDNAVHIGMCVCMRVQHFRLLPVHSTHNGCRLMTSVFPYTHICTASFYRMATDEMNFVGHRFAITKTFAVYGPALEFVVVFYIRL